MLEPAFSPFPRCFLPFPKQNPIFESHLFFRLQMLLIWTKNLLFGKELNVILLKYLPIRWPMPKFRIYPVKKVVHVKNRFFVFTLWCWQKISSTFYNTILTFNDLEKKMPFQNIKGKGENAGNQHFLLFPQCFLPFPNQFQFFWPPWFCCLQN